MSSETARSDVCRSNVCGQYARPGCMKMLCACPAADADFPDVPGWLARLRHGGARCPLGHWDGIPPDVRRIDKMRIGAVEVPVLVL